MLNAFVSVYVPSTKNGNQALSRVERDTAITHTAVFFSSHFGGCTAISGVGFYLSNSGELIREDITIIKAYTENKDSLNIARIEANYIKESLSQESVLLETSEGIEFI